MPRESKAIKEAALVQYKAHDGVDVKLDIQTCKQFLVRGHANLVTNQEFIFFMGICKSRALNPFAQDAYLIKYSQGDNAAIVVSRGFYQARANAHPSCRGWRCGVVIQRTGSSPPELEFREGHMVLDGENLVGGWFEAKPKGWDVTKKHTVGLKAYIKKKRTGEITQFWKEDKQPGMIEKVAEVQGLRSVFPSEFGNLYIQEEITDMITPDTMAALPNGSPPEKKREADTSTFDKLAIERLGASYPNKHLDTFIEACAKAQADGPVTPEQLKEGAAETFNSFWDSFLKWCLAQGIKLQPDKEPPPKKDKPPKTTDQDASPWDPKKVGHQRAGNGIDSGYVKYIKDNTGSWDKAPREWKENAIGKWMSFAKQGKEGYEGKEFPLPLDVPGDELTGQEGSQEPGEGQTETDPGSGTLGEPQTTPQEPSGASQEGDQTESHTTLSDVQDKGLKEPSREDLILRLEQVKAKSQDAWLYGRVNAKIRDSEPDVNTMPMEQLEDWADQAEIAFRDMF